MSIQENNSRSRAGARSVSRSGSGAVGYGVMFGLVVSGAVTFSFVGNDNQDFFSESYSFEVLKVRRKGLQQKELLQEFHDSRGGAATSWSMFPVNLRTDVAPSTDSQGVHLSFGDSCPAAEHNQASDYHTTETDYHEDDSTSHSVTSTTHCGSSDTHAVSSGTHTSESESHNTESTHHSAASVTHSASSAVHNVASNTHQTTTSYTHNAGTSTHAANTDAHAATSDNHFANTDTHAANTDVHTFGSTSHSNWLTRITSLWVAQGNQRSLSEDDIAALE